MVKSLQQNLTVISLLIYWPVLFVLMHIQVPEQIRRAGVADKSLHFVSYLILVFLLWFAISPQKKVEWRKGRAWWVFIAIVAFGLIDEVVQGWTGRSFDLVDLAVDALSALTGLVLFSFLSFWHALLLVTGAAVFLLTNVTRKDLGNILPVTNAFFHLSAYAFFTLLWVNYVRLFLRVRAPSVGWMVTAFAPPLVLLLAGKSVSVISGKDFSASDVLLAVAAITTVVVSTAVVMLRLRRRMNPKTGTR